MPRRHWRWPRLMILSFCESSRSMASQPTPAMARAWYEKAKELGSAVAPRRLEMLAREAR